MYPTSSYLSLLPAENVSINTISLLYLAICFIVSQIPNWVSSIFRLLSGSSHPSPSSSLKKSRDLELPKVEYEKEEGQICREEKEMIMGRLGIFCHQEETRLQEKLNSRELSRIFEEKEPSLEEVKEAFDVFDDNRDGFIDERELQRVLCVLGLGEGVDVERCRKMIAGVDDNGDGRIDFSDFVRFMEGTFS